MLRSCIAILHGLKLCLFTSSVRKLAAWPILLGSVAYFVSLYSAVKLHPWLVSLIVNPATGVLSGLLYYLGWLIAALLLLVGSFIISICMLLVVTSVFQTAIAEAVLKENGVLLQRNELSLLADTKRTILVEAKKLLWLLPILFIVLLLGFIPLLSPLALLFGAWLLAFQFVDISLDLYHLTARQRYQFSKSNYLTLISFGLALTALWALPFLGILLSPAATAAAAWLLSGEDYQKQIAALGITEAAKKPA